MCGPSMPSRHQASSIRGHLQPGHHLKCIRVGGRYLRNWPGAGDRSRTSGRRAAAHLRVETTRSVLFRQQGQQWFRLTVPPITNDPPSKSLWSRIGSRRAVPLQAGRVDEEAVALTARRGTSCAGIDADRLPARVCGVGQCQFQAPTLLVSWFVPYSMRSGLLPREFSFEVELLEIVRSLSGGCVGRIEETLGCSRSVSNKGSIAQTGASVVRRNILHN